MTQQVPDEVVEKAYDAEAEIALIDWAAYRKGFLAGMKYRDEQSVFAKLSTNHIQETLERSKLD